MNTLLRIALVALALAGTAVLGFWQFSAWQERQTIAELRAEQERLERTLAEREEMITRLSRIRRIAHITATAQRSSTAGAADAGAASASASIAETDVLFIELDESGAELARQTFTIPGDVLFVDAWVVKFEEELVAAGHPLFGRSLVLFRRLYSERIAPRDGFAIDTPGAVPPGYAASETGRFEQQIWEHFWALASDPEIAAACGVRVAQGEAVYKPIRAGETYELVVDADGGMSLAPLGPLSAEGRDVALDR